MFYFFKRGTLGPIFFGAFGSFRHVGHDFQCKCKMMTWLASSLCLV